MKRLFKKNQIMITALAIMIAAAGYLNFSGTVLEEPTESVDQEELLDISMEETEPGDAVLTSGSSVVAEAKITREQVRAQNKEMLMEIIDNENISEEQKQQAVNQMVAMTETSELEAAVETMLLSKGFSEAVVTITENGADVVVNNSELNDASLAQIEDIVTRKTGVAAENIVITPMHE